MRACVLMVVLAACSGSGASDGGEPLPTTTRPFLVTPRRVLANGTQRSLAIVRLRDDAGVPLANELVTVTTDGSDTIDPPTGMTNERGELVAAITSTEIGVRTVTATAMGRTYAGTVTFTLPCELPFLPNPPDLQLQHNILAGDFNSDGLPDLVGLGDSLVEFASGNGDGSFQPIESVPAGSTFAAPFVSGDFNGDGALDVVGSVYGLHDFFVLRGIGDGTFEAPLETATTIFATTYATGDIDDDGKLDIVATEANDHPRIGVYFGKGDGRFHPEQLLSTNGAPHIVGVVAAPDLDADGDADIAYGDYFTDHLVLYRSNGDRTFSAWPDVPVVGASIGAMEVADFNHDGRDDLAIANYQPAGMRVLQSRGNGQFDEIGGHGLGFKGAALVVGDYNNDARLDVVSTDELNLFVSLGNAAGTLDPAVAYPAKFGASRLQSADFNSDGNLDLALEFDKTSIVAGTGQGTFELGTSPIEPVKSVAVGDFDKDGKLDVATIPLIQPDGFEPAELWVRRGNGDGTLAGPSIYATDAKPLKVVAADINGDTWLDLVTLDSFDVNVFLNQQNGSFGAALPALAVLPMHIRWGISLADFNADGKLDIAATRQSLGPYVSTLDVALGNGNGTFGAATEYAKHDFNPEFLATGDVNNDGKLDIVGFPLELYLGAGNGTFAGPTPIYFGAGSFEGGVVLVDLTGDGNLDIIATSEALSVHAGRGDGTFEPPRLLAMTNANPELVVDLNNDGVLDIIASTDIRTYVILGRPDGTFRQPVLYRTGFTPSFDRSTAVDLDANGLLDLATPGGILLQSACSS